MEFLKTMGWVLLALVVLAGIFAAGKKGMFDKAKATNNGTTYTFSREKWLKFAPWVLGFLFIIGVSWAITGCNADWNEGDKTPVATRYCPAVMEDSIDMSPYEDRVKALAIEAQSKGIQITGDYWTDVRAQGGEMTLVGAVRIEVDANCQIVSAGSWMSLFNADHYPMTGGIDAQGNLGMDANFGGAIVNVRGQVVNGKVANGIALKSWLPHINGRFDGDWVLR